MNSRFTKELSIFTLLAAAFAFRRRFDKTGGALAFLTLGLRYLPWPVPYSYNGRHVVVTGGSRGLGLALAMELVAQGARVSLLARDADELNDALQILNQYPGCDAVAYVCDVTQPDQMMLALNSAHGHFGQIDMLINNAGAIVVGPFESMERDDFDSQIRLYLNTVVESTRQLLPYFRRAGGGRIVNISSIGGKIGVPHMTAYSAGKFALSGFSRAVSAELVNEGIHVTTVYPGLMRTGSPIQAVFKGDQAREFTWFAASDLTPGLSMAPERAARQILTAAARGETEVILSWPAKLGVFVNNNFPELTAMVLRLAANLMPHGQSLERKTGAQVYGWFRKLGWSAPLHSIEQEAAERFNQAPKADAEFNLGV